VARISVNLVGEGNGLVLHAVMHLCSVGFEIVGDEPVCGVLHSGGAARDPEFDADESHCGHAEEKEHKELHMTEKQREVGAEARWIHLDFLLTCYPKPNVTPAVLQLDLAQVML
jgi:hypothetical protein